MEKCSQGLCGIPLHEHKQTKQKAILQPRSGSTLPPNTHTHTKEVWDGKGGGAGRHADVETKKKERNPKVSESTSDNQRII